MALNTYREKRNFKQTPEPDTGKAKPGKALTFVIQRHDATRLHYDFRLEMDGVLKSWAVPKGPSLKAGERHLAVQVEDHPLDYGKFYGEIPEGNYGAGTVEIWDYGTYTPMEPVNGKSAEKMLLAQLAKGDLKITLKGKHLQGSFALVRMNDGTEKNWLLIKKKDEFARPTYDIEKIPSLKSKVKKAKAPAKAGNAVSAKKMVSKIQSAAEGESLAGAWKTLQKPMLTQLANAVPAGTGWLFEVKYDGYRAMTKINKNKVEMLSRNGNIFHTRYALLAKEMETVADDVVLDGEVVIEDKKGISHFQALQNYDSTREGTLKYYVYDILYLNGHRLTNLPLHQRKELLQAFFEKYAFKNIFPSQSVSKNGESFFQKQVAKGHEGIMAKQADSVYLPGKRVETWLKVKGQKMQEAIICGYTPPQNSRLYMGSLILGMYNAEGKLTYIGNCGTGFTDASLKELHDKLAKITTAKSPFEPVPKIVRARGKVTWVKPKLVCAVKFQGWTGDEHMRVPVFQGLRIDKKAEDVRKEEELPVNSPTKPKASIKIPGKMVKKTATELQADDETLTLGGKTVKLSNRNKLYWPKEKITKGELLDYYRRIAPYILPYLKDRPLSLNRHPNGIDAPGFYQKDMDVEQLPPWAKTAQVFSKSNNAYIDYLICNDVASLLYMVNLGCIEINPWHSKYQREDEPDYLMMDLDPGKIAFTHVVDTALVLKDICDELGIDCYCKTSGATGLHIFIPLGAKYTYDEVKTFAELLATLTHERLPKTTSVERSVSKRKNKIYVDFLQNRKGQTIAAAYSARPKPGATVSTPLDWDEVNHSLNPKDYTIFTIEKRLKKVGDLWKPVLGKGIVLEKVLKKLNG